MIRTILAMHIAGGSVALRSMFVPMVTRKGGMIHRRAGWVFVGGMTVVSVTAVLLAVARLLTDPRPEARSFAAFLFYIAILTAAGVSTGIRALRTKHRTAPHRGPWDVGISALLVGAAIAMAIFGFVSSHPLFMAFAIVGLVSGGGQLRYWLRPPANRMHWWFEHMSSMLGSCIAATTAFLVINAGQLGTAQTSILIWLAPTMVGVPAIGAWTNYYRRKFASAAAARRDTSLSALPAAPYRPSRIA